MRFNMRLFLKQAMLFFGPVEVISIRNGSRGRSWQMTIIRAVPTRAANL
jgi:hypothetical protein